MSSSDLIRWGGLAAMLAGLVFVVNSFLAFAVPEGPYSDVVFVVGVLLVLVGLVGFHALQKGSYGRIGRAGFYTLAVASLAQIVGLEALLWDGTDVEWLVEWLLLVADLGVLIGYVLYGVATLQARVLPRWCGVGFIVGLPASIVLEEFLGGLLFGFLWLALGYVLWNHSGTSAERPTRSTRVS